MQEIATKNSIKLVEFNQDLAHSWDALIERAPMGTLLHTRRFLSYHGDRFDDRSLLVVDSKSGNVLGVLPAAIHPGESTWIVSHPGVTYGGIIHDGELRGARMIETIEKIRRHYSYLGFKHLKYKAVPYIYHTVPMQEDIYALFRVGAYRYRCDISATADLLRLRPMSTRRRRCLTKAQKAGVEIKVDFDYIAEFWAVLRNNLADKHDKKPVHSVDELRLLKSRFPNEMNLIVAIANDRVIAGTLLFDTPAVCHAQYFGSTADGRSVGALDAVVNYAFALAKTGGRRYFDFGISSDLEGTYLNEGLHSYKIEFGSGTTVYEFYNLDL